MFTKRAFVVSLYKKICHNGPKTTVFNTEISVFDYYLQYDRNLVTLAYNILWVMEILFCGR